MREPRGYHGKGIFLTAGAFALGATIGSLVALLFAPASGKVTRRRIGLKIRSLQHTAARRLNQTTRVLAVKAEDVREAAAEQLTHAREWLVERVNGSNGRRRLPRRRATHHA